MKQDLKAMIEGWKLEYGKVFKTTIEGEEYIWRKLKRKEYVLVMADKAADEEELESKIYDRQEEIVKLVVLYPENIEEELEKSAGLATTLADEIIPKSGFGIPKTEEL